MYLTIDQLCSTLSISKPTEVKWRRLRLLPSPVVISNRVFYKVKDVLAMPTVKEIAECKE